MKKFKDIKSFFKILELSKIDNENSKNGVDPSDSSSVQHRASTSTIQENYRNNDYEGIPEQIQFYVKNKTNSSFRAESSNVFRICY